jgi:hypothetical protein
MIGIEGENVFYNFNVTNNHLYKNIENENTNRLSIFSQELTKLRKINDNTSTKKN